MDIEKKALELVNQERAAEGWGPVRYVEGAAPCSIRDALHRAIEAHEAFRREVSEAVEGAKRTYGGHREAFDQLDRFIIPQPDPLHECLEEALARTGEDLTEHTERLRAALAARGLKIVDAIDAD